MQKVKVEVWYFHSFKLQENILQASIEGPDLMSCPVASDLGLHYLPILH